MAAPTPSSRWRRRGGAALVLAAAAAFGTGAVSADEDEGDLDRAIAAGEVVPLQHILARIAEGFGGQVLKIELEHESEGDARAWRYEVKILMPEGEVLKLEYDARSAELLGVKGRREDYHDKEDGD